jgi:hypothetical protein
MASKRYERSGCLALSRQLARGLQDTSIDPSALQL